MRKKQVGHLFLKYAVIFGCLAAYVFMIGLFFGWIISMGIRWAQ